MANEHKPPAIDIPPGFEPDLQELRELFDLAQTDPTSTRRRAGVIEGMLRRLKPGHSLSFRAVLYDLLGEVLAKSPLRADLEKAITCYEQTLRFYTPEAHPQEYARIQNNLALLYSKLPQRDPGANLQKEIACYEQALRF